MTACRDEGVIDLSYSLFSEYVRTKLQLRPRLGFEEVEVVGKGESGVREPQRRRKSVITSWFMGIRRDPGKRRAR